jgi:hypothetical protein
MKEPVFVSKWRLNPVRNLINDGNLFDLQGPLRETQPLENSPDMCLLPFLYTFQNSTICLVERIWERGERAAQGIERTAPGDSVQLKSNPSEPTQRRQNVIKRNLWRCTHSIRLRNQAHMNQSLSHLRYVSKTNLPFKGIRDKYFNICMNPFAV